MKEPNPISRDILSALKSGEEQAFKAVYAYFSERLYGNILKIVKSRDMASEFLQKIFLKVWEKRSTIDLEGGKGIIPPAYFTL